MPFLPFTPAEKQAIATVLQHQHTFLPIPPNEPTTQVRSELHIALDGIGSQEISREIHPASGGMMNQTMIAAALSATGCRIIHNHPSQGSLSSSDWNVLAQYPSMEMTAVNSHGTTFRGKVKQPQAFSNWYLKVQEAQNFVSDEFQKQISAWLSSQLFSIAEFGLESDCLVGKSIAERLEMKGYVEFECILSGSDITKMSHQHAQTILQLLRQWCSTAIP